MNARAPMPPAGPGWLHRVRANLLATPFDAALTLLCLAALALALPPFLDWAVFDARFGGTGRDACDGAAGACWTFVAVRFDQFVYGFYPQAERWRVDLALGSGAVLLVVALVPGMPGRRWIGLWLLAGQPVVAGILLAGGWFGLAPVETARWGGLMLTLILAAVGIAGSIPLGILLALARRSELPVVRGLAAGYIELVRGVPLVTVLFMASVMFPLFLPPGVTVDKLVRAMVGLTLFAAAYMAEVVRGGLQAVPPGQAEASRALGLGYWNTTAFVVLPQALRIVIPGLINTAIGLFKDTTLVSIIGMFDLLGIVKAATTDPEWLGFATEGYVFAAVVFGLFCAGISAYGSMLERRGTTGRG